MNVFFLLFLDPSGRAPPPPAEWDLHWHVHWHVDWCVVDTSRCMFISISYWYESYDHCCGRLPPWLTGWATCIILTCALAFLCLSAHSGIFFWMHWQACPLASVDMIISISTGICWRAHRRFHWYRHWHVDIDVHWHVYWHVHWHACWRVYWHDEMPFCWYFDMASSLTLHGYEK